MRTILLFAVISMSLPVFAQYPVGSAVDKWGELKVNGSQLVSEYDDTIQLRGISIHGPQWYLQCHNKESFTSLVDDWKCNIIRLAMYVEEGGYNVKPDYWKAKLLEMIGWCEEKGVYCMLDWHMLDPGDPLDAGYFRAFDFWQYMSDTLKNKKHVLYEICNEPSGTAVTWNRIKQYADSIIPMIRANDSSTVIICGTPSWSSQPQAVVSSPLQYDNIMYTYHFYAASHKNYSTIKNAIAQVPVFVTEWGVGEYTGDGLADFASADTWLDIFNGNNPDSIKVSWIKWNYSDKAETDAVLMPGSCVAKDWTNLSLSGKYIWAVLHDSVFDYSEERAPFYSNPIALPGTLQIETYDKGGQGFAYYDSDVSNMGSKYRVDGVDIEVCDAGGYNVGWIEAGEWLEYTVNIADSGNYFFNSFIASPTGSGKFHIALDSVNISGTIACIKTGDWQQWKEVQSLVFLPAGEHIMRIAVEQGDFNFDKIVVNATASAIKDVAMNSHSFEVYPNPATNQLKIRNEKLEMKNNEKCSVSICNTVGQEIYNSSLIIINSSLNIDVSQFEPGLYFIRIGDQVQKFVKE